MAIYREALWITRRMRFRTALALLLFTTAFGLHLWWVTRGWDIPGLSGHEFRQTQTAISIWAMMEDGFRMDYSTPVLGKPWAVPFEFPIYQGLVYFLTTHSHLDLVFAGRLVSLLAFYLGASAFVLLLRRLGLSLGAALIGALPVFFAPVHILYSRAVLIESTAFAASAWFLYLLAEYREKKRPWLLAATLLVGAVAVLTKATTWAVFCIPWGACVLANFWRARKSGWRGMVSAVVDDVFLIGVPLLVIGFGWVSISDRIKEFNPIGAHLVSRELRNFNFGTWAQRGEAKNWLALWDHWNTAVMPWWALAGAALAVWWTQQRAKVIFGLGLSVFVGAPMVFFNLYAVHDYYFFASGWGLCLAVGAVAAGWWDAPRRWYSAQLIATVLIAAVAIGQYFAYRREFYGTQTRYAGPGFRLTEAINRVTRPQDVVVVHNADWSSALAFWSHRRMLMISDHQMYFHPDDVQRSLQLLADESVPLVVFWGDSQIHTDWLHQRIRDFHLKWFPVFIWPGHAAAYAREDIFWQMRETLTREPVGEIEMPDAQQSVPFKPFQPIAGTAAAADVATNLQPIAERASLPYGVSFRYVEGKKCLLIHPPTQIDIPVPAGAKHVEIGARMEPHAYGQKDFDGAYLTLELQRPDGTRLHLFEDGFAAEGPRETHYHTITLPENAAGKIILRSLPGPGGSYAFDWLLLEYLRVK